MFFRFRSLRSMAMCVWGSHLYHSTFKHIICLSLSSIIILGGWEISVKSYGSLLLGLRLKSPSATTAFGAHIVFLVCNGHPLLIDIKIFLSPFGIELYCILSESGMCSPVQFVRNQLAFGFSGSWH